MQDLYIQLEGDVVLRLAVGYVVTFGLLAAFFVLLDWWIDWLTGGKWR